MLLRPRSAAAAESALRSVAAAASRRAASSTAASSEPPVLYAVDAAGRATITLNAARSRNALSSALMGALAGAVARAAGDAALKLVVLRGVGPAFSAGHDLKELAALQAANDSAGLAALFGRCTSLMLAVGALPVPVIAAVGDGQVAAAAGCQLAASCDLLYAAPSARFSTPGVNIGLFCSTPGVALARAAHAKVAAEALFSGREYTSAEMAAAGMVTRVLPPPAAAVASAPPSSFEAALDAATAAIAAKPPSVLRLGKAALRAQLGAPGGLPGAYRAAEAAMVANLTELPECAGGLAAFIAKRPVPWAVGGGGH